MKKETKETLGVILGLASVIGIGVAGVAAENNNRAEYERYHRSTSSLDETVAGLLDEPRLRLSDDALLRIAKALRIHETDFEGDRRRKLLASGERTVFMTWDGFVETFKPVKNHIDKNAPLDGYGFETFGEEANYVRIFVMQHPKQVWTMLVNDVAVNGFTRVDRLLHFICEVEFSERVSYVLLDRVDSLNLTAKALLEICLHQNGLDDLSEEHEDYSTMIDMENDFGNADSNDIIKLVAKHLDWKVEEVEPGIFHPVEV